MNHLDHLDIEDLLRLTRLLEAGPVRDVGLLEAACARPRASVLGDEAYPALELKAAALLHSLVRNHALADGNERLAWLATVVFLDLTGNTVDLDDDAAFELVMAAAEGHLDVEEIAQRLATHPD
ncbi:MAG: alcohol dehydrogenase [Nitriliruptor sp.]|nr:MAG: alcohol dehydrogenase [Nitriliruptor sp.]